MPSWTPNWIDVRFDHRAAEAAAVTCEGAARVVAATGAERGRLMRLALASGRGPSIDALARGHAGLCDADGAVIRSLLLAATKLRAASTGARQEQAQREADRGRWRAEAADEARLLAAAHAPASP